MATELTKVPNITPGTVSVMTPQGYEAALGLAKTLVESGFLPKAIQRPAQALAVILAGQELGLPPMQSLRQIHIVEGKPTLSAELMLSLFKRRGGQAKWLESTDQKAELWLKHPNGDEHTEVFTWQDAQRAGVAGKDNWRKYPKAMLKARVISAGIRAVGEADGFYMPEELGGEPAPADLQAEYVPPPKAHSGLTVVPSPEPSESTSSQTSSPSAPLAAHGESAPVEPTSLPSRQSGEDDAAEEEAPSDLVECWRKVEEGSRKAGTYKFEFVPMQPQPRRSDIQADRALALRSERGLNDEEWQKSLEATFNKSTTALLSREEADRLIEMLEAAIKRWGSKKATAEARDQRKANRAAMVDPDMAALMNEGDGA